MYRNMNKKMKQAGMTLIEVMMVLAIGTLILASGVGYFSPASQSNSAKDLTTGLASLQAATKSLAAGTGNYGIGNLNGVLILQNRVPSTLRPTGTTILTPAGAGSAITVTGATNTFSITITTATINECVSALTSSSGYISYKVGAAAAVTTTPADPFTAGAACAAPATVILTSN